VGRFARVDERARCHPDRLSYLAPTPGEEDFTVSTSGFEPVTKEVDAQRLEDPSGNVEWNRRRWGQEAGWQAHDHFGYRWGSRAYVHTSSSVAKFFDTHLRPYTGGRYDLDVLEISPGAGRSTVEIIRYANTLALVDLNEAPIEICRERLKYYPNEITYHVNDGQSLECVADREFDLVASYDSMVHVHPDIVRGYIRQSIPLLRGGGVIWMDHSGKGARETGKRSSVTAEMVAGWAVESGLELLTQIWSNDWDCISVLRKPA
jgi:SAM-dependent methyltransferase